MLKAEDILSISRQISEDSKFENPRYELKRGFWELDDEDKEKSNKAKDEFVKDLTAMANAHGTDSYVIVGIDEDTGELFNNHLPIDAAKLVDIIYKKLQEPFDAEFYEVNVGEKYIIVIHIPQSFNKPHVLKTYNNRQYYIPIRKGTRIDSVTRYDLDLMYSEKNKLITPPYKLEFFLNIKNIHFYASREHFNSQITLNILNSGFNINALKNAKIVFYNSEKERVGSMEPVYYADPRNPKPQQKQDTYRFGVQDPRHEYQSDLLIQVEADKFTPIHFYFESRINNRITEFLQTVDIEGALCRIYAEDIRNTVYTTDFIKFIVDKRK